MTVVLKSIGYHRGIVVLKARINRLSPEDRSLKINRLLPGDRSLEGQNQ